MINYFAAQHGISKYYVPRTMLQLQIIDFEKDCKFVFGIYVQAHDEPAPRNTNEAYSLDWIYL